MKKEVVCPFCGVVNDAVSTGLTEVEFDNTGAIVYSERKCSSCDNIFSWRENYALVSIEDVCPKSVSAGNLN